MEKRQKEEAKVAEFHNHITVICRATGILFVNLEFLDPWYLNLSCNPLTIQRHISCFFRQGIAQV